MSKSIKIIVMVLPLAAIILGGLFTLEKFLGLYEAVPLSSILIYDGISIAYLLLAWIIMKLGVSSEGNLNKKSEIVIKIITVIMTLFQWNYVLYVIPSHEMWAFCGFFVLLSAFFFDSKVTIIESIGVAASLIIYYLLSFGTLMPANDAISVEDFALRVLCTGLSLICICCLTDMGGHILVKNVTEVSEIDPLTHLMNRKRMKDILDQVHETAVENDGCYSILIFDIDDFKRINDTYGHDVGDKVLVQLSDLLSDSFRKNDYIFRWGGEEFLAIVMCNNSIATRIGERITRRIENEEFNIGGGNTERITVTAGVASYEENISIDEVIKSADDKLYLGKKNGKNQVVN